MVEEQAPKKNFPLTLILIIAVVVLGLAVIFLLFSSRIKQQTYTLLTPTPIVTFKPEVTPTLSVTPQTTPTPVVDDTKLIKQAILAKLGLTESQVVVTISQNTGQHAKGGVREIEAVGGGYFLAAKIGDNWVIVYDGQANPTCAQIAPYNFPTSIVPECLDASGKVIKR